MLPQILPAEDAEIAALARKAFEKARHRIITGAKVGEVEKSARTASRPRSSTATASARRIAAERLISAVGVVGNVEGLGPRGAGRQDRQGPHRHRRPRRAPTCPASTPSATSPAPPMLAHKAEHEGVICVEAIKGLDAHPLDKRRSRAAPTAARRSPRVGLTEAQGQGRRAASIRVGRFPFAPTARRWRWASAKVSSRRSSTPRPAS